MREKLDSFGRKNAIACVPPVVVTTPRIDVPLAVVAVPVHVDNTGALVYKAICTTTH